MTSNKSRDLSEIAIIGGGNIGTAIARGLVGVNTYTPEQIVITRRQVDRLAELDRTGFQVQADNQDAVRRAVNILIAVLPQQLAEVLEVVGPELRPDHHRIISIVSGVSIGEIVRLIGKEVPVVRAIPNTAVEIGESMTCLAAPAGADEALAFATELFNTVGQTLVINEELMTAATALAACGLAFFLRSIRAASQGGIEIGFHPEEALLMAAQTAKGAASLARNVERHPESAIDRVTSPRGATIAGLNRMEHEGFSSAMIKGIVTSAEKVAQLYAGSGQD